MNFIHVMENIGQITRAILQLGIRGGGYPTSSKLDPAKVSTQPCC